MSSRHDRKPPRHDAPKPRWGEPGARRPPLEAAPGQTQGDGKPRQDKSPQKGPPGGPRKAPQGGGQQPGSRKVQSEVIYGRRASLAVIARRPTDVLEVLCTDDGQEVLPAGLKMPVREVDEGEMIRLAGSPHSEGLCVVAKPRAWVPPAELAETLVRRRGVAVALDRVRNAYNIGAILRTAAFFGIDAALLGAPAPHPALAPDAIRVAEGGAEHLLLSRTTDLADTLARLKARGVQVVGAESDSSHPLFGFAFRRPTVVILGHEREGMSERIRAQCDAMITIPGSGAVGSLNVAVAASITIAELVRPRG